MAAINFHFIKHFFNHYLTATRVDVLHSPFVFELYQTCIKKQKHQREFTEIEALRRRLKQDGTIVEFNDMGAGSSRIKTSKKTVSKIAHHHLKPERIAKILYFITQKQKCKNVLELGTSLGITTSYLAKAISQNYKPFETNFCTVEGSKAVFELAHKNFKQLKIEQQIKSVNGNFDTVLNDVLKNYTSLDLVFVDGNHRKDATLNYFETCLPLAHNNSIFIFDDIYWSPGMTQAWEQIKRHPQVQVTVDLFFIGLVFFRKEQVKEHFKLRVL